MTGGVTEMYNTILFDLDGTLTESGEGIIKSVQHALEIVGRPEPDAQKLRFFIGPPLAESFMRHLGCDSEFAQKCVAYYRERFSVTGIFENALYPGVYEMLETLKQKGLVLAVASSKPEHFVEQVLEHFQVRQFFDEAIGSTLDEKRIKKADVIEEALERMQMKGHRAEVLMVGDKEHDVLGARQAGLSCVAVSYGYGTMEELEEAAPLAIVSSVAELTELIIKLSM